jgi:hypothetical protein
MNERAKRIMREFRDVFPETLPPLSPEYLDSSDASLIASRRVKGPSTSA